MFELHLTYCLFNERLRVNIIFSFFEITWFTKRTMFSIQTKLKVLSFRAKNLIVTYSFCGN